MAQKIKIIDVRDFPSTDPKRVGKLDRVVTYQIDPFHTYIITIPKEEFSEERLKAEIRKQIEEREKLVGKEIEI